MKRDLLLAVLFVALALFMGRMPDANAQTEPYEITSAHPESVQKCILAAYNSGRKSVTIAPGLYYFEKAEEEPWHLRFSNLKNFEINAEGATFIFKKRGTRAILFDRCEGVTLRGLTMQWEVPAFSQGKITAISSNRRSIDVRIDPGYPNEIDDPKYFPRVSVVNVYQQGARHLKPGVPSLYTTAGAGPEAAGAPAVQRLGDGLFRFNFKGTIGDKLPVTEGDPVAWRGTCMASVSLHWCSRMHLEGVTLKGAGGFGYFELYGEGGNRYDHCSITYPDVPKGAVDQPLLSNAADGFHSDSVRTGPCIKHCLSEGINDDQVNIHGRYGLVMEGNGKTVMVDWGASCRGNDLLNFARKGDRLRFYDRRGALCGEANVEEVKLRPDYIQQGTAPEISLAFADRSRAAYLEVTLDQPVKSERWSTVINANMIGSGFVIRKSIFRDNRAHGIFIQSGDGIIEDCVVEGTENAGIIVSPEMTSWPDEGDFARHLVIQRNTLRNVALAGSQPFNSGVTVAGYTYGHVTPLPGGHRNIVIRDNIFEDNPDTNIVISSAIGVEISGNRFIRPISRPLLHDTRIINPDSLIWIREADQVKLKNNSVESEGAYMKRLVDADASVKAEGIEDGVTICK
jgi:hypothetical protein